MIQLNSKFQRNKCSKYTFVKMCECFKFTVNPKITYLVYFVLKCQTKIIVCSTYLSPSEIVSHSNYLGTVKSLHTILATVSCDIRFFYLLFAENHVIFYSDNNLHSCVCMIFKIENIINIPKLIYGIRIWPCHVIYLPTL